MRTGLMCSDSRRSKRWKWHSEEKEKEEAKENNKEKRDDHISRSTESGWGSKDVVAKEGTGS